MGGMLREPMLEQAWTEEIAREAVYNKDLRISSPIQQDLEGGYQSSNKRHVLNLGKEAEADTHIAHTLQPLASSLGSKTLTLLC